VATHPITQATRRKTEAVQQLILLQPQFGAASKNELFSINRLTHSAN
jgi:hypothetical protein